ncbi:SOSS complex subunit B2-like [Actinia tenebrosa]|uniref:SOSS complex subunit B2-like n=1 Tax=Actinia tenebrosa TaxID=6105 RepID=A0A6P8IXZ9_ACTTE|nr:SOSS complex subunit B2-like [Actinia tenebrosa]
MADEKHVTEIKDIRPSSKNINCIFICLEVGKPTQTKDGHTVRSCRVADKSGSINVSVWDEFGDLLQPGDIIRFTRGYANIWKGSLTLYTGRMGSLEKLGDFCLVFSEVPNMSDPSLDIVKKFKQQSEQGRSSPNSSTNTPNTRSQPQPPQETTPPSNNQHQPVQQQNNSQRFNPFQRPEPMAPTVTKSETLRDPRLRSRGNNNSDGNNKTTATIGNSSGSGADHGSRNVINSSRDPRMRR